MPTQRLHYLVLLYLAVAYETDHHLDPLERQTVIQLASQWTQGMDEQHIEEVVDAAYTASKSGHGADTETIAHTLGTILTPDQRRHVLTDLGQIARADGYLTTDEASVISRIRTIWGSLKANAPASSAKETGA